jgi:two-component system CheB/CheR fusion protein
MSVAKSDSKFEDLLQFLRDSRGFDFCGYKRPTLMRRVEKRMQFIKMKSHDEYMDYLEVHPEEFAHLFNSILINVTSFFRDPPAWDFFQREVIPKILKLREEDGAIRVWSAGCASGEEAYTLVMVFAEAMGVETFQRKVKIYATDVDEEALTAARQGIYTAPQIESVPEELRKRYFQPFNDRYVFLPEMRRAVIFGRHDLIQDAPISHLDLLVCRNTLMYFNAEAQTRILGRFHFALNRAGFLFLGKAELLLTHANLFLPTDMKTRIFTKVEATANERLALPAAANSGDSSQLGRQVRLREAAFDSSLLARIIVNHNGILVLATQRARTLLGLIPRDVGRPLQDLEIYYRPVELRPLIDQAYAERRTVTLTGVERRFQEGDLQYLDVHVTPLFDDNLPLGIGVTYVEVTAQIRMQEELQRVHQELETSSEELQSTNEELETTNEELQSTNEELETMNEELQSTNEELETMNEELQSTNEELHALNDEIQLRGQEVDKLNHFLRSILSTMSVAVVVLDNELLVRMWNLKCEDLWGLRSDEVVGKPFLTLDIGLPVDDLKKGIRSCLTGQDPAPSVVVSAVNRRGRAIHCQVTCTRLAPGSKESPGVILIMEEAD